MIKKYETLLLIFFFKVGRKEGGGAVIIIKGLNGFDKAIKLKVVNV